MSRPGTSFLEVPDRLMPERHVLSGDLPGEVLDVLVFGFAAIRYMLNHEDIRDLAREVLDKPMPERHVLIGDLPEEVL